MERRLSKVGYVFLCVNLCCFSACRNMPDAPISEEKLIPLLVDMHTAEALLEAENQNMRDSMAKIYYAQIFERHRVQRADFDSTMAVYTRNPVQLDTLYNRVLRLADSRRDTSSHK